MNNRTETKLSVIVCSRSSEPSGELSANIRQTAGLPYELIWIDNSKGEYSIFSAYNAGVARSKGDILVFCHEDIFFHTSDWGKVLERLVSDPRSGMVGVFGFQTVGDLDDFRVWGTDGFGYLIQGMRLRQSGEYLSYPVRWGDCDSAPHAEEVVFLDGLFLAASRTLFDEIRFDEKFGGFHAYDFDICMQAVEAGRRNMATNEILIEHYSPGNFDRRFAEANARLYAKWRHALPLVRGLEGERLSQAHKTIESHRKSILPGLLYISEGSASRLDYRMLRTYLRIGASDASSAKKYVDSYVHDKRNPLKYRIKLWLKYWRLKIRD